MYRTPAKPASEALADPATSTEAALLASISALERRNQELEEALAHARREIARLRDALTARGGEP